MSNNQEKLNEQLFNVVADEKVSDEARLKKVKYLVRLGADVNAKDNWGETVLMNATRDGNLDMVKYLAKNGADLDAKDKYGWTALIKAAQKGQIGVVKYLAENGADIEARDNYERTALDIARKWEKADCVEFLEEYQKKNSAQKNKVDKTSGSPIVKTNEGR